jgi:DNA-binding transcriptional regulator GbsR (MarR family)
MLSEIEKEIVNLFVRIAGVLNLPRSVGELYGILFISPEPMCIDDLMRKLKISKGSTSQGLKILRSFGAVNPVYVEGDRRDFFTAESESRKIIAGFVNEQIRPQLDNVKERVSRIESLVETEESLRKEFLEERVNRVKGWQKRVSVILPFAMNFIKTD